MTQRKFITGDDWLYYKIYCGVQTSQLIMTDSIAPLVRKLSEQKLINSWFFVRYRDPEPHIRFRLRLSKLENLGVVIALCRKSFRPAIDNNQVWKIQTDTYVRELERYGNCTITYIEDIFCSDSDLILNIFNNTGNNLELMRSVLLSVDSFLNLFNLSIKDRAIFYQANQLAFNNRLGINLGKIKVKTKEYKSEYFFHSKDKSYYGNLQNESEIQSYISSRNERISRSVKEIIILNQKNELQIKLFDLLQSIVHMFFNRAFADEQIIFEILGYSLLMNHMNFDLRIDDHV